MLADCPVRGIKLQTKPLVVITRPKGSACQLTQGLASHPIDVFQFPVLKRVKLAKPAKIQSIIDSLPEFAAMLFTSAHSVDLFFDLLAATGKKRLGNSIALIAIGAATAASIEAKGFRVTARPPKANSESMIACFAKLKFPHGAKVLYPTVQVTRGIIEANLPRIGINLVSLPLYKLVPSRDPKLLQKLVSELQTRPLLIFTFFSSSAFTQFLKIVTEVEGTLPMLKKAVFAALGPVTQNTIEASGYPVSILAKEANSASLAEAIWEFLAKAPD